MSFRSFRGRGKRFLHARSNNVDSGPIQPPPVYPVLDRVPQPLLGPMYEDIDYEYLLTLSKSLRSAMNDSPLYIVPTVKRNEIERYSDRYQIPQNFAATLNWKSDDSILPAELHIAKKQIKRSMSKNADSEVVKRLNALEKLEKKDITKGDDEKEKQEEEEVKKGNEQGDQEDEELEEEEEDYESENDYNVDYYASGHSDVEDSNDENAYY